MMGWGDALKQKNWLPFISPEDGKLYFIYSFCPYTILRYNEDGPQHVTPVKIQIPCVPNIWRGSASPVPVPMTAKNAQKIAYVCLVHESAFPRYAQRWVGFDSKMNITHVSDRFCLSQYKIEVM